jgi:photosystem II stability/assembly factor-like uncharacterized protein
MYLEARVWSISTHAANPTQLYAGSDMGLVRFDEVTARWAALPSPATDVWAIAQHPQFPDTLIIGSRPAAFFRSDDAGNTWRKLAAPGMAEFSDINMGPTRVTQFAFDPLDSSIVWASVEIGGLYRSVDGGEHWTLCDQGLISADVHGIAIIVLPSGKKRHFATTNKGFHRSDDDGATWQFIELDSPWQYTRAIVPRADNRGVLFLTNGNGPPGNTGRLLVSRDFGETWSDAPLPGTLNSTPWCVAVHASDPMLVFMCTNLGQLYRSSDGGATWTRLKHEFGEVRSLHWRSLPAGTRKASHSITVRAPSHERAAVAA